MGDLEKALNRKEIARRDCSVCHGQGWHGEAMDQKFCETCGGTGFEEKEVPYDFAAGRNRTPAELREIAFGEKAPRRGIAPPPDDEEGPFVPPRV